MMFRTSLPAAETKSSTRPETLRLMLRTLLADRFHLVVKMETRPVPGYALSKGKGEVKLKEGSCIPFDFSHIAAHANPNQMCRNGIAKKGLTGTGSWSGLTLDQFAKWALIAVLDRPVIDQTGIAGKFNFHLEFAPDQATPFLPGGQPGDAAATPPDAPAGPTIFTALQEQLGLKLVPAKGPRDFLIIDHVERPSDN